MGDSVELFRDLLNNALFACGLAKTNTFFLTEKK